MSNSFDNAKKLGEMFNKIPAESREMTYEEDDESVPKLHVHLIGIPMNVEFNALADYIIQILSDLKHEEK